MSTVADTATHGQTLTSALSGDVLVVTIDQPNEPVNTLSPALAVEFEEICVLAETAGDFAPATERGQ